MLLDLKREVNKEREKSTAFEAEADMHKNYANEIMSELNHLEQKTVYELNDKLTSLQTQLKASENNLWEKNRAFNIARNTISDLTNQLESSKCGFSVCYLINSFRFVLRLEINFPCKTMSLRHNHCSDH